LEDAVTKPKDSAQAPKGDKQRDELPDAALDKVAGGEGTKPRDVTPGRK
jgi:hypothetical protein